MSVDLHVFVCKILTKNVATLYEISNTVTEF